MKARSRASLKPGRAEHHVPAHQFRYCRPVSGQIEPRRQQDAPGQARGTIAGAGQSQGGAQGEPAAGRVARHYDGARGGLAQHGAHHRASVIHGGGKGCSGLSRCSGRTTRHPARALRYGAQSRASAGEPMQ
jgi:hypothetical protein